MNDFPIPVVRLIIENTQGEVLILQRAESEYATGSWCLPGGKVNYGDTVEQSAARELQEETSLVCNSLRFLFYQDSLPLKPGGMQCVNLYFECAVSGNIVLNNESSHFEWIGPSDLEKYEIAFRNDLALICYWKGHDNLHLT
ncbi:MAG: NUDIX domain-containing protein [Deltaproteobacteria bacterium]|nr:NUDIX domain-containing protein [Deltaproteobacteria bacterium]